MGIIRVGFIENISSWYQRATGGTPTTVLSDLATTSVEVQKRSIEFVYKLMTRSAYALHNSLLPRVNVAGSTGTDTANIIVVKGIDRVGFRAKIEESNIFVTAYIFFLVFVVFVVLAVLIFKLICEGLVRAGRMKGEKFIDFRNGWTTVLKGILFRVVSLPAYVPPPLCF